MNPRPPSNSALALILALYAAILILLAVSTPLRLDETLQLAQVKTDSLHELFASIATSPGAAPLHYLCQWPFVALFGPGRLAVRGLSILWSIGAAWMFWRLLQLLSVTRPLLCLALFLIIPYHLTFAATGRPFEQALFFLLLALLWFFKTIRAPSIRNAAIYATALLATIYTEPFAVLPAAGCLLAYLRGIAEKSNRRAFWYLLPATALPGLLYLPFAIWAAPQNFPAWLTTGAPSGSVYDQALQSLTGSGVFGVVLSILLLAATLVTAWRGVRDATQLYPFCCFGAVAVTLAVVLPLDVAQNSPVWPSHLVFLVPFLVLLLDSATQLIPQPSLAIAAFGLTALLAGGSKVQSLMQPTSFDPQTEAAAVARSMSPQSCVVFVSEGLSKWLFVPFAPSLENQECKDFFHKEIVLAIHPFVRPDQRDDAESFFRGLNLRQVSDVQAGGGHVITLRAEE